MCTLSNPLPRARIKSQGFREGSKKQVLGGFSRRPQGAGRNEETRCGKNPFCNFHPLRRQRKPAGTCGSERAVARRFHSKLAALRAAFPRGSYTFDYTDGIGLSSAPLTCTSPFSPPSFPFSSSFSLNSAYGSYPTY